MLANTLAVAAAAIGMFVAPGASAPTDMVTRRSKEMHCVYPSTFTITNQSAVFATPELVSGIFVSGPGVISAGYSYSKSYSYTVSVTISAELVPEVFQIGVSTAWGLATTWGTSISAAVTCPANLTCGIVASPLMLKVDGTQTIHVCGSTDPKDKTFPCREPAPDSCPPTAFTAAIGEPFDFAAYYPLSMDHSTVAGQDLKAVHYQACSVGKTDPAYPQCPDVDSVTVNETAAEKEQMHKVDSLSKRIAKLISARKHEVYE